MSFESETILAFAEAGTLLKTLGLKLADALSKARPSDVSHFYFDYLKEAAEKFEGALMRLKNCDESQCQLSDAIDVAHRIKGNAAMYGHADLGLMAGRTEARLRNLTAGTDPANTLLSLIELIEKIHDICQGQGKSEPSRLLNTPAIKPIEMAPVSQSADLSFDRRRILIGYQDIWVSELMASLLGAEFLVTICETSEEIHSEIRRHKPDLIILESCFGGLEGLDFLRALKRSEHTTGVPVFMSFDPNSPGEIAEALSLGVDGFSDDKHEILDIVISAKSMLEKQAPKVLIVDDDVVVRDLLSHALKSAGMEVDTMTDGLEALKYLSENTPDIVLLDRFMPRLDGGTVLYEIQNKINLNSIPVLILTAMVNQGEAKNWFERGAADFIPKPFDPEEVVMRVKRHLKKAPMLGHESWG